MYSATQRSHQHVLTGFAPVQFADPVVQAVGIGLAVENVLVEQGDKAGVIDVAVLLLKLVRIDEGGRQIGQRRTIFKLFAPVEIARLVRVSSRLAEYSREILAPMSPSRIPSPPLRSSSPA